MTRGVASKIIVGAAYELQGLIMGFQSATLLELIYNFVGYLYIQKVQPSKGGSTNEQHHNRR